MGELVIKVCGVTRIEDARAAARGGASWLGLNFWPGSKRLVDDGAARDIARVARDEGLEVVGVFVNEAAERIAEVVRTVGLARVQLHGDESPADCRRIGAHAYKALGVATRADAARAGDYPDEPLLLDTASPERGGTGRTFDWSLAARVVATGRQVILAGGLTPANVGEAVRAVRPWGVDVASGVEIAPGIKDADAIAEFVRAARGEP